MIHLPRSLKKPRKKLGLQREFLKLENDSEGICEDTLDNQEGQWQPISKMDVSTTFRLYKMRNEYVESIRICIFFQ